MQHPEFEEAPARLPDPIGYPQPDGKSALGYPELICKREEQAPYDPRRCHLLTLQLFQCVFQRVPLRVFSDFTTFKRQYLGAAWRVTTLYVGETPRTIELV